MKTPTGLTIKFSDNDYPELATLEITYPENAPTILAVTHGGKLQGATDIEIVRLLLTAALSALNAARLAPVDTTVVDS